jgi:hypothetical protein
MLDGTTIRSADEKSGAIFSDDRRYRYGLWRCWDNTLPAMNVIGLNPSTADETVDDPTIRRCVGFAYREGCGTLVMTNLFALRSTDPKLLRISKSPVGPENDDYIFSAARGCELVVAAWGADPVAVNRARDVIPKLELARAPWLTPVWCLGKTKSEAPKHPLYLAKTTPLEPFC